MAFDYFYRSQTEQFAFIRIPKTLITNQIFSELSVQAKLLYGLLIDKMGVSIKNNWIDEANKVYVVYPVTDLQTDMSISRRKTMDCLEELEEIGLLERKGNGPGIPDWLYIKNFSIN